MLITMDQLTERLQASKRTIERHISAGRLRAIDLGTGKHRDLRFEEDDVEAFLRGQRVSVVKYTPKKAKQVKSKVDYLS